MDKESPDKYAEIRSMSQEDRDDVYQFAVERSEEMSKEENDEENTN